MKESKLQVKVTTPRFGLYFLPKLTFEKALVERWWGSSTAVLRVSPGFGLCRFLHQHRHCWVGLSTAAILLLKNDTTHTWRPNGGHPPWFATETIQHHLPSSNSTVLSNTSQPPLALR
jgi:hypothetical protein